MDRHAKNLTQCPGYSGKSGTLFLKGLWIFCVNIVTAVSRESIFKFWREDEDSGSHCFCFADHSGGETCIPPHPAEITAVDSGENDLPIFSELGTGRMEVVFDSSRGRCRGGLLYFIPRSRT
jgi:hypothetical protein